MYLSGRCVDNDHILRKGCIWPRVLDHTGDDKTRSVGITTHFEGGKADLEVRFAVLLALLCHRMVNDSGQW